MDYPNYKKEGKITFGEVVLHEGGRSICCACQAKHVFMNFSAIYFSFCCGERSK